MCDVWNRAHKNKWLNSTVEFYDFNDCWIALWILRFFLLFLFWLQNQNEHCLLTSSQRKRSLRWRIAHEISTSDNDDGVVQCNPRFILTFQRFNSSFPRWFHTVCAWVFISTIWSYLIFPLNSLETKRNSSINIQWHLNMAIKNTALIIRWEIIIWISNEEKPKRIIISWKQRALARTNIQF